MPHNRGCSLLWAESKRWRVQRAKGTWEHIRTHTRTAQGTKPWRWDKAGQGWRGENGRRAWGRGGGFLLIRTQESCCTWPKAHLVQHSMSYTGQPDASGKLTRQKWRHTPHTPLLPCKGYSEALIPSSAPPKMQPFLFHNDCNVLYMDFSEYFLEIIIGPGCSFQGEGWLFMACPFTLVHVFLAFQNSDRRWQWDKIWIPGHGPRIHHKDTLMKLNRSTTSHKPQEGCLIEWWQKGEWLRVSSSHLEHVLQEIQQQWKVCENTRASSTLVCVFRKMLKCFSHLCNYLLVVKLL